MPLLADRNQIAIKQEATAGTAPSMDATNVILTSGRPEIDFDFAMTDREAMSAALSPRGSVRGARKGTIRWKQYLRGTATAPVAGSNEPDFSVPFKGCGAQITVSGGSPNEQSSFKPSSTLVVDDTNGAYCTVAVHVDGKRWRIIGAVGNCKLTFAVGAPVLAEFEFQGRVDASPIDSALLVPTYPTVIEPAFLSAALSVLGYTTALIQSLTLDFGNEIAMRPDPNGSSGYFTAQITRRRPRGAFDPEETLAATKNWMGEWNLGTVGAITTGVFPSGGTNYNQLSLTIPNAAYTKVGFAEREGIVNSPVEFECRANSDAGDDEWELIQT